MSVFYEFESVDAFTTGALGKPGSRIFFLQTRQGRKRVTVKCEKQQVSAIVQYFRQLLSDLPPPEDRPVAAAMQLAEPVEQMFVLGPIGLGYNRAVDRVVVQLEEMVRADEDGKIIPGADGHIRVHLTRGQAASFCEHAELLTAAGRPNCQWCTLPIDPDGHACPRMN